MTDKNLKRKKLLQVASINKNPGKNNFTKTSPQEISLGVILFEWLQQLGLLHKFHFS